MEVADRDGLVVVALGSWRDGLLAVVEAFLLVAFVAGSAVFFIWLERKVAGRIQDRLGPTRVGGKFGWLQTIADGIKLLVKEDLIPADADQMLFRLGPYIAFCGSFAAFIALPFANGWVAKSLSIGVFFMLAVMSTEVFGIILAGYGSGSKWALFGGMREAAQMVSYEVPMALCVLVPVIVAGSMDLNYISQSADGRHLELVRLPRSVHLPRLLDLLHLRHRPVQARPVRPGRGRERAGGRLPHRVQRPALVVLLHGRVRQPCSPSAASPSCCSSAAGTPAFCRELSTTFASWLGSPEQPSWLGWVLGNVINVVVFILKGWLLVFVHDVGALDAAAAAHRPGDDDLPEIPAADQLRAAAGRQPVAGGRLPVGRPVFQLRPLRRVPGPVRCGWW